MPQIPSGVFLRLPQIIGDRRTEPPVPALIPVSKSTWWRWVSEGRAPKPIKLGPNTTAWRSEDIAAMVKRMGAAQ